MSGSFLNMNKKRGRQIFLFPYLGGSFTAFYSLAEKLDQLSDYEIWAAVPPGHLGSSRGYPTDIEDLINSYLQDLLEIARPPYLFFGHSMGGIIAYFLTREMKERGCEYLPERLILSAAPSPLHMAQISLSTSDDNILLSYLNDIGGLPREFVEDPEMIDYFLPVFRDDYRILEEAALKPMVTIPIITDFIWCISDKVATSNSLLEWQKYISGDINVHSVPYDYGHMFITEHPDTVARIINDSSAN